MSARLRIFALAGAALTALGCSGEPKTEHISAAERGEGLFRDGSAATYGFSCATCHAVPGDDTERALPGGDLRGATERTSFWGGQENDLLRSLNDCRERFQGITTDLSADAPEAADLYAWLASLQGDGAPVPFTVVVSVKDLSAGDASHGQLVFEQTCAHCHGALHSGDGRLHEGIETLPDDVLLEHRTYAPDEQRLIFVEKVRHGGFLGYGGLMPPFSLEALSDDDLADLLAFLELYPS